MSAEPRRFMTPEEYLALEQESESKHEYLNGEIYAMTGASRQHNIITLNVGTSLRIQARGKPCQVYPSDMRVKVRKTTLYTYPDVSVVCGKQDLEDTGTATLLNPTVIIEVLSPSTERYDRGRKFLHYQMIDALQEYLLVAQDMVRVEQYVRQSPNQWMFTTYAQLDEVITLPSISCTLRLADIYEDVDFPDETPEQDGA